MSIPQLDPLQQTLPSGSRAATQEQDAQRVVVWFPLLATAGYSGPSANFLRLFAEGSNRLRFTLVTSVSRTRPVPASMELQHVGAYDRPLRKHEQLLLIASMLKWILVHRNEFDVFYGLSTFHYSVIPAFFAHLLGRKAVVRPAGQQDYDPRTETPLARMSARFKRAMLRRLDGVVAINSHIRDRVVEYGLPAERVCYAPNSVDVERFQPAASAVPRKVLTVVHVGGWTARKRLHVLVEAARIARDDAVDVRIVSAGPRSDPAYAERIDLQVRESGLTAHFDWVGEVQDIENVYQQADVFCLPSAAEGMPNALLEAMSCGLPAIVTTLPGTADVVREDLEGFLLPQPEDEGVLAEAVASLIMRYARDRALVRRHGEAARDRILTVFSKDRTKARIEAFLAGL